MEDKQTNTEEKSRGRGTISRRDVLRAGGVAGGVAVAGGVPAVTDLEQPVGEARGLVVTGTLAISGTAALAGATGIGVGLAGAGVYAYLTNDGEPKNVKDVQDAAGQESIYFAAESVFLSSQSSVAETVEPMGVAKDGSGNISWVDQQNNAHRNQLIEHATSEVAFAYDDGKSKSEAVKAGMDGARAVSYSSEITLIQRFNQITIALTKLIKRQLDIQNYNWDNSNDVFYIGGGNIGVGFVDSGQFSSFIDYTGDTYTDPDNQVAIINARNCKSNMNFVDQVLDDSEKPENYDLYFPLAVQRNDSREEVNTIDLYAYTDDFGIYNYSGTVKPNVETEFPYEVTATKYSAGYDGSGSELEMKWLLKGMEAVVKMRQNFVENSGKLDAYCEKTYNALESGDITVEDLISGRQLYQELEPSEGVTRRAVELAAAGATGELNKTVTVTTEGNITHTGNLFIDSNNTITVEVGKTINSGDYDRMHIIHDDGSRSTVSGVDVTIDKIGGSSDSSDSITYEPPKNIDNTDTATQEEIRNMIKDDQKRYKNLKQDIAELEDSGGGGGFGFGGLGDVELLAIAGGAGLAITQLLGD